VTIGILTSSSLLEGFESLLPSQNRHRRHRQGPAFSTLTQYQGQKPYLELNGNWKELPLDRRWELGQSFTKEGNDRLTGACYNAPSLQMWGEPHNKKVVCVGEGRVIEVTSRSFGL